MHAWGPFGNGGKKNARFVFNATKRYKWPPILLLVAETWVAWLKKLTSERRATMSLRNAINF